MSYYIVLLNDRQVQLNRVLFTFYQFKKELLSLKSRREDIIASAQALRKHSQLTFTCSNSTIETLEKDVKYAQS